MSATQAKGPRETINRQEETMTSTSRATSHDIADDHDGDQMLTLKEASRLLRVPEGTLRYWRHLSAGPRSFRVGRHVRYWKTDIILWLAEQTTRP